MSNYFLKASLILLSNRKWTMDYLSAYQVFIMFISNANKVNIRFIVHINKYHAHAHLHIKCIAYYIVSTKFSPQKNTELILTLLE